MTSAEHRLPMVFPGQASQSVGMATDLAAGDDGAAAFLASVDGILDLPLTKLMFAGPAETLTETRNAQPAILAHSVAVTLALRDVGIRPSLVAGHSLGEFSAAVAADALSPRDALKLVRRRGELMFAAGTQVPGSMAAVMGLPGEQVAEICNEVSRTAGVVVLANHNSETQVAISGEKAAVGAAGEALTAAGARRVIPLNVSGAFHSPLLAEAAASFRADLDATAFADPAVPLLANVSAAAVTTAAELRDGFGRQLTASVRWHEIMNKLAAGDGRPRVVLEVGPGKVLSNLARRAYPDVTFVPVGSREDVARIPELISG